MNESDLIGRMIDLAAERIAAHADELTALDQAIGDGDHGDNMRRGFAAMAEERDTIAALPLSEALKKAGMVLVMKVGGASGPLYGSALMAMGKAGGTDPCALIDAAIDAVKARGKSDTGAKTMLDVLAPVRDAVAAGATPAAVADAADAAAEATIPMRATKGRAAYLGERSIGHVDPGARSSAIIVRAVCEVLEES